MGYQVFVYEGSYTSTKTGKVVEIAGQGSVLIWLLGLLFLSFNLSVPVVFAASEWHPHATSGTFAVPGIWDPTAVNIQGPFVTENVAIPYVSVHKHREVMLLNQFQFAGIGVHFRKSFRVFPKQSVVLVWTHFWGKVPGNMQLHPNCPFHSSGLSHVREDGVLRNVGPRSSIQDHFIADRISTHFLIELPIRLRKFNPELRPLGTLCCFYLGESSIGALLSRSYRILQSLGLALHVPSLGLNRFQGSIQEQNLRTANYDQQTAKSPVRPIGPVLTYRHGGKFADRYGIACIFGTWLLCIGLGWPCAVLWETGRRRLAAGLGLCALLLNIAATASGIIGCLPWHWGRCGQQQTEYHHPFTHGENVSQKPLDVTWEPVRPFLLCLHGFSLLRDGLVIAARFQSGGGL